MSAGAITHPVRRPPGPPATVPRRVRGQRGVFSWELWRGPAHHPWLCAGYVLRAGSHDHYRHHLLVRGFEWVGGSLVYSMTCVPLCAHAHVTGWLVQEICEVYGSAVGSWGKARVHAHPGLRVQATLAAHLGFCLFALACVATRNQQWHRAGQCLRQHRPASPNLDRRKRCNVLPSVG